MTAAERTYQAISARQRRDDLILTHLPLVRHTIGRLVAHLPTGLDLENLEGAGTLGLVEAASKFDPEHGVKFETFAAWRIRGAVFDELRRNSPIPQNVMERIQRVRRAYKDNPAPVLLETLVAATGLTADEVADCLAAMRMTRMLSLHDLSDQRTAHRPTEPAAPDEAVDLEDQKGQLAGALTRLPQRERLVVTLYYLEQMRLKEIGGVLGLSESRVSRILNAALYDLGEMLRGDDE